MNYANIKTHDIANGPGVRVSLFVSGCTHRCRDCFNQEAWDFDYGQPFDQTVMDHILELLQPSYIKGITYLGGRAFSYNPIKELNLPSTLYHLNGFEGCSLEVVILPDTVTEIGSSCFQECKKLSMVYIPPTVTKMDRGI